MINLIISKIFQHPSHADEHLQRQATVLYGLSISTGLAGFIGFLGVIFVFEEKLVTFIALSILIGISTVTYIQAKSMKIRSASLIFLSSVWVLTTILVCLSGGMRSLDAIFYISGTVLAGLLLGRRGMNVYGGAAIFIGFILVCLDALGVKIPAIFPFPARSGWLVLILNLAIIIPSLTITLDTLSQAIENSKHLLENQKQIQVELRSSEEKFSKVFHASPMAILLQGARDRRYIDINESFTKITGYSREEALEKTNAELNLYPDQEKLHDFTEKFLTQGYIQNYEIPFRKKNGRIGHALGWGEQIELNGEIVYIGGTIDITERVQAEHQIQQLNEELEQRVKERTAELEEVNKELEAFSYSISHDLRAPLRGVSGFSAILFEDYGEQLDASGRGLLEKLIKAAREMSDKIDGVLLLSRLSRSEMQRQTINLSMVATDVLELLQAGDPKRSANYQVTPDLMAYGDPVLIRIVLENLLGNAWKYSSKNPQAQIEFGKQKQGSTTVFFIKDNGAGFDMAYADKLFGTFQRLHSAHEFEGHGIGLATVKRIIHRHNGDIWVQASPGQGATFYFTLGQPD
ncbi:MAG TPA: hypothetical protein DEH22_00580 [Chloroflexi bacterium]|nr:hypothetical protein [Chloroflexota bacterium]